MVKEGGRTVGVSDAKRLRVGVQSMAISLREGFRAALGWRGVAAHSLSSVYSVATVYVGDGG